MPCRDSERAGKYRLILLGEDLQVRLRRRGGSRERELIYYEDL